MERKPTYEELAQKVRSLEKKATEQERGRKKLKYQSYILNVMTSQMEDMVYFKNKNFRYIFSSKPHCERILKCSQEACIGKTDAEIAPFYRSVVHIDGFGEIVVNSDDQTLNRGRSSTFTERAVIDGKEIYLEVCKTPLFDRQGKFAGIVGCSRDITERMRVRQQVAEQQALLRCLVDSIPATVYFKDRKLQYLAANKAFADMVGAEDGEIAGKTDYHFFTKAQAGLHRKSDHQVMNTGDPILDMEEPVTSPDGDSRWVMTTKVPYRNEEDNVAGMVGISIDITERKNMEESLRRRDAVLQAAAFVADCFLKTPDWEDRVDEVLESLSRGTGISRVFIFENARDAANTLMMIQRRKWTDPDIASQTERPELQELYYQNGFERWEEMLGKGEAIYGHTRNFPPNERKVLMFQGILSIVIVPIFEGSNWWGSIAFNEHIKEREWLPAEIDVLKAAANTLGSAIQRKHAEDVLRHAKEDAEQANRAKTHFLANISHEIRTPMNAIIALTELVLKTELTHKQQDYLTKVSSSARTLLGMLNDILDFSKFEAGKLVTERAGFQLHNILDELADMFGEQAATKGIEMNIGRSPDVPDALIGDPVRLKQILVNLIGNAVKFTESGEIFIKIACVRTTQKKTLISFSIKDTGIGVEQENITRIFSAFTQADGSTTRNYGGTGLGLAISKSLVHLMGGNIQAESTSGRGSTFSFTLPFERPAEEKEPLLIAKFSGLKALIADDSETGRQVLYDMAGSCGLEAALAASGEDALKKLKEAAGLNTPYQLVLTDRKKAGPDGFTTAEMIRQDPQLAGIPIIMLTNFDSEREINMGKRIGVNACLTKPVKESAFFDALADIFHRKETQNAPGSGTRYSQPPVRILLVDDSAVNQKIVLKMLDNAGILAETADNGKEATDAVKKNHYDVVLMDIQMPVMNGYEATGEIRKWENEKWELGTGNSESDTQIRHQASDIRHPIPVIAMTADTGEKEREKCLRAGMNDFISKPFASEQLLSVLEKWIKQWKSPAGIKTGMNSIDIQEIRKNFPMILPGIDIEAGLLRLQGNRKLFIKLLKKFAVKYTGITGEIKDALSIRDMVHACHLAHGLKGVAGNLSLKEVQSDADLLETAVDSGRSDDIEQRVRSLEEKLTRVLGAIQTLNDMTETDIGDNAMSEKDAPNLSEITPMLIQLGKLIAENDIETEYCFESVKKYLASCDIEEETRKLEAQITGYEFDEAQATLKRIADTLGISLTENKDAR